MARFLAYVLLAAALVAVCCSLASADENQKPSSTECEHITYKPIVTDGKLGEDFFAHNLYHTSKARRQCQSCCKEERPKAWGYLAREAGLRVCHCGNFWNSFTDL